MKLEFHQDGLLDPPWLTDGELLGLYNYERGVVFLLVADVSGCKYRIKMLGVKLMVSRLTDYNIIGDFYFKRLDEDNLERCFKALHAVDEWNRGFIAKWMEGSSGIHLVELYECSGGGMTALCERIELETQEPRFI